MKERKASRSMSRDEAPMRREKLKDKEEEKKKSKPMPSADVQLKQAVSGKQAQLQADLARRGNVQQAFKQLEKTQVRAVL